MTHPMSPELWEFRKLITTWEHGEMTLEELYEKMKDQLTPKQMSFI